MRTRNIKINIFLNKEEPDAENGDIWIDPNGSLDDGSLSEDLFNDPELTVSWDQIVGTPTTLEGYGIRDNVSYHGHLHRVVDITDFPKSMPANGGDAATVDGHKIGDAPGDIPILNQSGTIDINVIPDGFLNDTGYIFIQSSKPANPKDKSIWFCTADNSSEKPHVEVYVNNTWIKMGSVWKG